MDTKEFEIFDGKKENTFLSDENKAPEDSEEKEYSLPHTLTLREPISLTEKNTVTELVFKNKLNLGMLAHFPTGENDVQKMGHMMPLIIGMTGQTELVVKRLDVADAMECFSVVNYFLTCGIKAAETGGTT